ncbi:valyl tRNA synthetase modifier [Cronobacter phage S13]|jgi:hypothetical protein|uniref:Uncharacterized protein n=1 Tax=Cronobacter phage LPCS28 TaxID=2924885 RepID=A0AAE9K6I3_9CAUD|nr:valyl tRNA synthetase modifier [Cronobacter phage S13]YP_010665796.1 hypothetical protein PQB73_gp228 [Cronobacter phage LPCS28]AIA65013.1 hypothetical protein S13_216 [Cronobacter phage S13]UNY46985.1 hypothetical protein EHEKIMEA_00103 [Cronobacter phage LPCS28]
MKNLLIAALLFAPSAFAYEPSQEEVSFVCKGEQQCINIVNDELSDITVDGNLRVITPDAFREQVLDYCEDDSTECQVYVKMMINTFDQAYRDGEE